MNFYGNNINPMGAAAPMSAPMMIGAPTYYTPGNGIVYGQAPKKAVSTLSKEDLELLKKPGASALAITDEMIAKSHCNHKDTNGDPALIGLGGNRVKCNICGAEFDLTVPTIEDVETISDWEYNFFQTLKLIWVDPPREYARPLFTYENVITQMPTIYKMARNQWDNNLSKMQNYLQPGDISGAGVFNQPNLSFLGGGGNYNYNMANGYYPQQGSMPNGYYPQQQVAPMPNGYYPQQATPMPNGYYPQQAVPMPNGGYCQQPPMAANGYYPQQQVAPMPVGGTMLNSGFVQGGVVPPVNDVVPNNNMGLTSNVQDKKPPVVIPQPPQAQAAATTPQVPQVPMPPQAGGTATTSTTVNV